MNLFRTPLSLLIGVLCVVHITAQKDSNDVLIQALQDEMDRSLTELRLEGEPSPYFVSYGVTTRSGGSIAAVRGAVVNESSGTSRTMSAAVRVGDRVLDSTKYYGGFGGFGGARPTNRLPLTDSYDELRRVIWQFTDEEYKQAISALSGKKSILESQAAVDRPNDFNEEEPFTYESDEMMHHNPNFEALRTLTVRLSALFKGYSELQEAITSASITTAEYIFLDSDGNFHRDTASLCSIQSEASTQATDGRIVGDFTSAYAYLCDELPSWEELAHDHQAMIDRVIALKDAEALESYTGPAIFDDQASAQLLLQTIGERVSASPQMIYSRGIERQTNPFLERIGNRVFARFLNVVNDPTMTEYEGERLYGSYVVDTEGVPAKRVSLIEDGKLQTLLTNRSPVKGIDQSSGSDRLGRPAPGNLIVTSSESMTRDQLHEELLQLVDDEGYDYGLVIRRLANFSESSTGVNFGRGAGSGGLDVPPTLQAYKVYPDGTEVAILPLSFSGFVDKTLKDVVAVSDTNHVYNVRNNYGWSRGGRAGLPLVGIVTPSYLLEEISLADTTGNKPNFPIVSHPLNESIKN